MMSRVYSCQYEPVGEGENAVEVLAYEPLYTQRLFEKPSGATFNGFPAAEVGELLIKDEEGQWHQPDEVEEELDENEGVGEDGESDDESDFYEQWDPPPTFF